MSLVDFYSETRARFPEITSKADQEQDRLLGDVSPDFAYLWFESLANALNAEMVRGLSYSVYAELVDFISRQYSVGSKEVKGCIDVAFTENLFWRVPADKARPFWDGLPDNLKNLYVAFHGHGPF